MSNRLYEKKEIILCDHLGKSKYLNYLFAQDSLILEGCIHSYLPIFSQIKKYEHRNLLYTFYIWKQILFNQLLLLGIT